MNKNKLVYIETCSHNPEMSSNVKYDEVLKKVFDRVSYIEDQYDKDLCNFTITEILSAYKLMNTYSLGFLYTNHCEYLKYTTWCLNQGLVTDGQNHFQEVTDEMMLSCVNTNLAHNKIISREDLIAGLDSSLITNYQDKCIVLAIFEGMTWEEIHNFSIYDVEGNVINLPNRKFTVSNKLLNYIKAANDETEYFIYGDDTEAPPRKLKGDNVIKWTLEVKSFNHKAITQRMMKRIWSVEKMLSPYQCFNYNALRESGRIDLIKKLIAEYKEAGKYVDNWTVINDNNRGVIKDTYGFIPSIRKWLMMYEVFLEE